MPNYIMGSGERLEITVDIKNSGEDAFNTVFFFQVSEYYLNSTFKLLFFNLCGISSPWTCSCSFNKQTLSFFKVNPSLLDPNLGRKSEILNPVLPWK